jgi:hypothetical protein
MKRTLFAVGGVAGLVLGWLVFDPPAPRQASANAGGPPAARTGAPAEQTCADGCHTGNTVNDGVGSVTIVGVPTTYTPGMDYTITVSVSRTLQSRWGFQLTCIKDSDQLGAGTFTNTTDFTATQIGSIRNYINHTISTGFDGTFQGAPLGLWSFTWTAPAAGAGTVTFYAAANAANGDLTDQGDFIYTTSASSTEETGTPVDATTWGKIKLLYR